MKPPAKKWATLDEHAHVLASVPGTLPPGSIKQQLFIAAVRGMFDDHMRVPNAVGGTPAIASADIIDYFRAAGDVPPTGLPPPEEGLSVEELVAKHGNNWSAKTRSLVERQLATDAVEKWCAGPKPKALPALSEKDAKLRKRIFGVLAFGSDRIASGKTARQVATLCKQQNKNRSVTAGNLGHA